MNLFLVMAIVFGACISQAKNFSCVSIHDPYKTRFGYSQTAGIIQIKGHYNSSIAGKDLFNATNLTLTEVLLPKFGFRKNLQIFTTQTNGLSYSSSSRNIKVFSTINIPKIGNGDSYEEEVIRQIRFQISKQSQNMSAYSISWSSEINIGPNSGTYRSDHFYLMCETSE